MSSTINKFKPNIIFNLAAESHVDRSIQNPKPFIYSNIIGTYSLLCAANEYYKKILKRTLIILSSFIFRQMKCLEIR